MRAPLPAFPADRAEAWVSPASGFGFVTDGRNEEASTMTLVALLANVGFVGASVKIPPMRILVRSSHGVWRFRHRGAQGSSKLVAPSRNVYLAETGCARWQNAR